jgi:hypothetical protein
MTSRERESERSAAERRLRAKLAAHALHAQHDSREITAAARAAFLDRFSRQVDPDGRLPPAERAKRAEHARREHMTRLALRSAQVRATRRKSHQTKRQQKRDTP